MNRIEPATSPSLPLVEREKVKNKNKKERLSSTDRRGTEQEALTAKEKK
jgi:hypothetical protein